MKKILYYIVGLIAKIHDKIGSLNDAYERRFNDKQLHFIVIGILGLVMTFLLVPLVKRLVEKKKILTLTWIYVFTILIVLTFAIEIGQDLTHTGNMEFEDIVYGIFGFVVLFAIYAVIRTTIIFVAKRVKRLKMAENKARK